MHSFGKHNQIGVKFCGVTEIEDAKMIASHGADAFGFLLLSSPAHKPYPDSDRLSTDQAKKLCFATRDSIQSIMLLHEMDFPVIKKLINTVRPSAIQIQSNMAATVINTIRHEFHSLYIIKTVKIPAACDMFTVLPELSDFINSTRIDALLLDSERPGHGVENDWKKVSLIRNACSHLPVFVAGGLSATNIQSVIRLTSPDWVDVMSSVSDRITRRKVENKIINFLQLVRGSEEKNSQGVRKINNYHGGMR